MRWLLGSSLASAAILGVALLVPVGDGSQDRQPGNESPLASEPEPQWQVCGDHSTLTILAQGECFTVGVPHQFIRKPYVVAWINCAGGPGVPWIGDDSCNLLDTFSCEEEPGGDGSIDLRDWMPECQTTIEVTKQ